MINDSQQEVYEFEDFRLDTSRRLLLRRSGAQIPLTPKVFDTLLYLVRHNGKAIGKDELMSAIWTDTIVEENNLSQNISILRRLLGEKRGEHRFIATIPGYGFKFVADVAQASPAVDTQSPQPSGVPGIDTRDLLEHNQKLNTEDRSTSHFRVIALAVLILGLASIGAYLWRGSEIRPDAPIRTIAVLPFRPLVAEHRDEALEMGMADTLISRLASNQQIVVRPLGSIRNLGDSEQDAVAVGRALDVEAVLDGSIQRWGDRIRINTRLIRIADGTSLWAGTFEEKFTDIFVVQDAISNKVVSALAFRLSVDEKTRLTKRYTDNVEAYGLYLKGRYHVTRLTPAETQKGILYFQQAIDIDPNYALAYAGLARAYQTLPITGDLSPAEYFPKAKAAANRAIEIDDQLAEAHAVLGWLIFWYEWDWKAAENQDRRAIELNPNSPDGYEAYAHLLSNTGRHAEALAQIKRARELDPLNLRINALEGQFLLYAGETDEALTRLLKTLELSPDFWLAHLIASSVYAEKGMYTDALAEARKAEEFSGASTYPIALAGYALAKSGSEVEARATLGRLLRSSAAGYALEYRIALVYNGLGDKDETLTWLEKAYERRDRPMVFLKVEPKWNNLRNEPRFIELMRRMRF